MWHRAQAGVDRTWFADLQTRDPVSVTISTANLQVNGDSATAETRISAV